MRCQPSPAIASIPNHGGIHRRDGQHEVRMLLRLLLDTLQGLPDIGLHLDQARRVLREERVATRQDLALVALDVDLHDVDAGWPDLPQEGVQGLHRHILACQLSFAARVHLLLTPAVQEHVADVDLGVCAAKDAPHALDLPLLRQGDGLHAHEARYVWVHAEACIDSQAVVRGWLHGDGVEAPLGKEQRVVAEVRSDVQERPRGGQSHLSRGCHAFGGLHLPEAVLRHALGDDVPVLQHGHPKGLPAVPNRCGLEARWQALGLNLVGMDHVLMDLSRLLLLYPLLQERGAAVGHSSPHARGLCGLRQMRHGQHLQQSKRPQSPLHGGLMDMDGVERVVVSPQIA
mmetsp:Transcript_78322/g.207910  ORF Transcript_78322/g.207910 Transcript_78322/m.207910 type:complete len:344 (+) Transcript_78322:122-1153(+)